MTKYMIWILILLIIDLCIVLGGWLYKKKRYEELKEENKYQYAEPFWKSSKKNRAVPIIVTHRTRYDGLETAAEVKARLAKLLGEVAIEYAEIIAEQDYRTMGYAFKARIYVSDLSQNNSKELFPEEKHE